MSGINLAKSVTLVTPSSLILVAFFGLTLLLLLVGLLGLLGLLGLVLLVASISLKVAAAAELARVDRTRNITNAALAGGDLGVRRSDDVLAALGGAGALDAVCFLLKGIFVLAVVAKLTKGAGLVLAADGRTPRLLLDEVFAAVAQLAVALNHSVALGTDLLITTRRKTTLAADKPTIDEGLMTVDAVRLLRLLVKVEEGIVVTAWVATLQTVAQRFRGDLLGGNEGIMAGAVHSH